MNAPINQTLYRIASMAFWSFAILTLVAGHYIIGIACGVIGFMLWKASNRTYEKEATELSQATEIIRRETDFEKEKIRSTHIDMDMWRETGLKYLSHVAEVKRLAVEDKAMDLQDSLLETGIQQGLMPEAVSSINEYKYRTEIDLEKQWKEIVQDLDAGDLYLLSDQQLIKKLTGYLAEQLRDKHAIEIGDDPPQVKQALLTRYDKNISYLEAKIDARQAGLLLPENGEEAKRIGEGETDSPGYSESESEAVQEQTPAKRRRGRPRKNPAE